LRGDEIRGFVEHLVVREYRACVEELASHGLSRAGTGVAVGELVQRVSDRAPPALSLRELFTGDLEAAVARRGLRPDPVLRQSFAEKLESELDPIFWTRERE